MQPRVGKLAGKYQVEFVKTLGVAKLATIFGVTAGVLLGLILIISQLAATPMTLLYSGLDYEEAGQIMQRLDQAGVPYEIDGNGTMIFAPKDQVLRLRMDLASEGLPSGGTVGYEIFDTSNALNTTAFVQDLNRLRALEGELSRTITSLSVVDTARVHLVIPERSLFTKDKEEPTASIMINGRGDLGRRQVQAIQTLVAAAVPGLTPARVAVVDDAGGLLASLAEDENGQQLSQSLDDRTATFEKRMRNQVKEIVASIVGEDAVRVQVSAEIDFNRIIEQSETYDPDSQVARSTLTIEESSSDTESRADGAVSVANSLPEAEAEPNESNVASANNRLEEKVNFEISRTTKTETQEAGRIQRLSVAVVVDGSYAEAADGTETYTPRTQDEMDRITSLVRSAIGFNETRGDTIEVLNLAFAKPETPVFEEAEAPLLGLVKDDYMRMGEILAAIIVAGLLVMVLKTVLTKTSGSSGQEPGTTPALAGPDGQPMMALPAGTAAGEQNTQLALPPGASPEAVAAQGNPAIAPPEFRESALAQIDVAQIQGKVKDSSVKKVGELVSSHPDESLSILRNWLHEA